MSHQDQDYDPLYSKDTPWGAAQGRYEDIPGLVYFTPTSGHGGMMIEREYAEAHLSAAALVRGIRFWDGFIYFEEDLAWQPVAWEIPAIRPHISDRTWNWGYPSLEAYLRANLSRDIPQIIEQRPEY